MTLLNQTQVQKWDLRRPKFGCWRADLLLTEGATLPSGRVTITCGTMTLTGNVMRAGFDATDRPHVIVVGGLGWQGLVERPLSWQVDSGVRLNTVLKQLASLAHETIVLPQDMALGTHYELIASRPGEPVHLADALNNLVRHGYCPPWRVDDDGVTRFGERTSVAVTARATLLSANRGVGIQTYGIDDPAQFLPGNTIEGTPIERYDLREAEGKLEVDIYSTESALPMRDMIHRIVAAELGDRCRTYRVAVCRADGRCDLVPPPDSPHLPELKNVEQWTVGGETFIAHDGDECVVEMRDERGTRPVITGFKRLSGSDPTSFPPTARQGDLVQAGGILQMVNFSSAIGTPLVLVDPSSMAPIPGPYLVSFAAFPGPVPPTPISAGPLYGTISSGSHRSGTSTS